LRHALHIQTWQSLCVEGSLDDADAVELMVGAVLAAVRRPPDIWRELRT
jgi:hypothetical protein